jgi:hypothetical protein
MKPSYVLLFTLSIILVFNFSVASADSITPSNFSATISVGDSTSLQKEVLVTKVDPTTGTSYSVVSLDVVGLTPGLTVSFTPGSFSGAYDRSIDRTFGFTVGFSGDDPNTYNFEVIARVDGAIVARESDSIIVADGSAVPEPTTILLLGTGLLGLVGLSQRRRKS